MEENIDDYQINPNITSYNTLLKKIDDYGPLNKVINDINILQEIISYPDNGLLLALIEKINYTYDILPKFYSLSIILSHIVELIQKTQLFQVTFCTTLSLKLK